MTKEQFIVRIEDEIQKYITLSKTKMTWAQLRELAEFEMLLDELIDLGKFDFVDLVKMKRYSEEIADKLRFDDIIFYFSTFHYVHNHLIYDNELGDLSKEIFQMNIQINIMRIQIKHGHVTGCSEDDYYFSRGLELVRALSKLADKGDNGKNYIPFVYLLLNYMQSLFEYMLSGDNAYATEVKDLIKISYDTLNKFAFNFESISLALKNNVKLRFFMAKIYYMYYGYKGFSTQKIIDSLVRIEMGKSDAEWALLSLYEIESELFKETIQDVVSNDCYDSYYEIDRIIALRNYIRWLKISGNNEFGILKLPSVEKYIDNSWFRLDDYFNGYDLSVNTEIDENDRKKVNDYDDGKLRQKLSVIIKSIDKNVVGREARKPHGPMEIADMELPIRRNGEFDTYYLCLPVKSGREISGKVSEQIAYQVIRPFTNFGNRAIVVFVSVKEATEGFYNYIKRAQVNLGLDIYIIDGESLIKLLKYNNQID